MNSPAQFARVLAAAAALAALAVPAATRAQTNGSPIRFTANAVNMSDVGPTGSGTVVIEVDRWSTDAERDKLLNALWENGPDKLLDVLRDMPRVGYIRTPTSIGWNLHYARRTDLPEGGHRIVLATDRPIGFREAANQTRSINYPFTVIEIHMNKDGEGEGKMSVATRITGDKDLKIIELENYATQPVMLKSVKAEKVTR